MALKNTYAKLPAKRYIELIEQALVQAGAVGLQFLYENQKITGLAFLLEINKNKVTFQLPINWKKVQMVLKKEGVARYNDDEYAYRVSWAIMKDWVEAQMAILASENVTMPQLFLPYAMVSLTETLFEKVSKTQFLLGESK